MEEQGDDAAGQPLTLRALPAKERAQAKEAWLAAERVAGADATAFCGWDWTKAWLEQFGEVVPHHFAVAERGGAPCGAVLVTRSARRCGPVTIRSLHLGTVAEPDDEDVYVEYNGLCVAAVDRVELARALLTMLHRTRGWDELHLDGFDPAHAAPLLAAEPGFVALPRPSPVLDLDGPQDDLVSALTSRAARKAVQRSLTGLVPYETEWAQDLDSARLIFESLVQLHQERWTARGEPGAFATDRLRGFHRALIERWLPCGRVMLFCVRHGGQVVAALYGFVVIDTLQIYQCGFKSFESNRIRAGYAAHLLAAAAARERGLSGYEYLAGDSRYKTELSTSERTLVWACLRRHGPRGVAVTAGRDIKRSFGKITIRFKAE